MKDIMNEPLVKGDLVFYGSWGGGCGIGAVSHETPKRKVSINLMTKTPVTRKQARRSVEPYNLLKLVPWFKGKTPGFDPDELNHKKRTDITGLEIKPGHLIAYPTVSSAGGYATATHLTVGKIVAFGPRGGARVAEIMSTPGRLDHSLSDENDPTYFSECLILNESFENRILIYKLINK